jgi:hypothetical protein
MSTTKDKDTSLKIFRPSANIIRDAEGPLNYIVTPNSKQVFGQLVNNYKTGSRSFNIIGAYGTGKSSFLLALEKNINGEKYFFSDISFSKVKSFSILNLVGENTSLMELLADYFGLSKNKKLRAKEILASLEEYYQTLEKKGKGLMIVIDEFGKFLEYAAKNNPESELYFIQQLAEFANDTNMEILFITTLHQDFNEYSKELSIAQKNEWGKVKGRLKEITFNEPVEQLLFLASETLGDLFSGSKDKNFHKLFNCIEKSKAFPLKDYFSEDFAEKLLPFDILSASILTIALQRYGQNERSLFSFIHSNDPLGLWNFNHQENRYYHLGCVYDYLIHNYYSHLTTRYNPDYAQWAGIRTAIERAEGVLTERLADVVKIIKAIGLLNIFSPASLKLDIEFLKAYCSYSLNVREPEKIIKTLEGLRIIRFVKHSNKYILFEGTDLDIELAINEAGQLVEKVTNVVHHLNQYFDFPYVAAKAVHYEYGTPRFFAFRLSEFPIQDFPEGEIDGYVNLIFSDKINEQDIITTSRNCKDAVLYGWYSNNNEIRNLLFEIDKIKRVKENHDDDKVAMRELDSILQHQIRLLNHYVTGSLYKESPYLKWFYKGEETPVSDRKSFNRLLSTICGEVYSKTPSYKNEMVNKSKLSSPIQAARKNFIKALVENWDKKDLGFEETKFPPEKTIYLSLLRETGIHRGKKGAYSLGEPTNDKTRLGFLWKECSDFLETTFAGRRNLQELVDILLARPYKLKQGFIEFWLPFFLFTKRDDFALFNRNGYIPYLTQETLELVCRDPKDFEVKAFHIDGIRLNLFNGYRILLNQSTQQKLTNKIFIDTIRPFLTFYKNLPEYATNTSGLEKRTLALRNAIATAKDPEDSFFIQFPKAMGYDINELHKNPRLLKEYSNKFQESIKEIRQCYDDLVLRVEDFILNDILGEELKFPGYRTSLQNRYNHLKEYLLLPYQKAFYQRLYSETNDKKAWLNSITQACLDKPLESINDLEEKILYDKLKDIFHELDNLTDISKSGFDIEKEIVFKFEITSFVEGLKKNLVRLPKSKTKQLIQLQSIVKAKLSNDRQLNIATLAKILEEFLENEN